MRVNESIAVSATGVVLVPYERHHVLKYHAWMEDQAIRDATASERLTLEEEYENQESWRASHDKLTFIICRPESDTGPRPGPHPAVIEAGAVDRPECMVGDVNFFLYPWDEDDDEDEDSDEHAGDDGPRTPSCVGEVDIMIADPADRRRGLGRATVVAFLGYILRNKAAILREYASSLSSSAAADGQSQASAPGPGLKLFMAKVKADNEGSIALFKSLGFTQRGGTDYFGEIKLMIDVDDFAKSMDQHVQERYVEVEYRRTGR